MTERTRVIGIRMVIGARRRDVLGQFLIAALTLSLIGCGIGLLLGVGGAGLVGILAGLPVAVTPTSARLAAGVSFLIGVFFWYLPGAPRRRAPSARGAPFAMRGPSEPCLQAGVEGLES